MTDRKHLVKHHFGDRAPEWPDHYGDLDPSDLGAQNLVSRRRFALRMLEAATPPGSRVLDVGCGTGEIAAQVTALGYEVWGLDIAEPMIREARERFKSTRLCIGDAEHMPFPDRTFEAVVSLGVFEYLATDEHALREIRRVLRPGGTVVVSTPSATSPLHHLDRGLAALGPLNRLLMGCRPADAPDVRRSWVNVVSRRYRLRRWLGQLRATGFEPQESICHGWGWHTSALGYIAEAVFRRGRRLRRRLPRRIGQALHRTHDRLVRTRAVNWLGAEQIVRARMIKLVLVHMLGLWVDPHFLKCLDPVP
jgi:ubiquinone/menaquinone biosynthesis C-methylase UbiE